jgi:hypothetical protein
MSNDLTIVQDQGHLDCWPIISSVFLLEIIQVPEQPAHIIVGARNFMRGAGL